MTLVTIILQYLPEEYRGNYIEPRINDGTCSLGQAGKGSDIPLLWYFHLINIFTLLSILGFFTIFLWNIGCGLWTSSTNTTDRDKAEKRRQRMRVVIKMFFVMGLTWIADIIDWAIETKHGKYEIFKDKGLLYSGLFFVIINSSQGIIMFIVVYFDSGRIQALKDKYTEFTNSPQPKSHEPENDSKTRESRISMSVNNGIQMTEMNTK